MKKNQKPGSIQLLTILLGLSFAISGCANFPTTRERHRLEERISLLEKKFREISVQTEKNSENIRRQETKIGHHQALLDRLTAEKVTPESPKAVPNPESHAGERGRYPADIYRNAFGNYASGRYRQAILGFGAFLERYPDNSFAPNAHFWLGQSHYALKEYHQALKEFDALVTARPENHNTPEALEKMVVILLRLREEERARKTADFLLRNYPESSAAKTLRQNFPQFGTP